MTMILNTNNVAYFKWTCPHCGLHQTEEVDSELGPFCTVICEHCQSTFDDRSLTPGEVREWDQAIDKVAA